MAVWALTELRAHEYEDEIAELLREEEFRASAMQALALLGATRYSKRIAEFVRSRFDQLDCLVNNAGYGLFGAFEDLAEHQIRRQLEVNFFGAALLTRELLPALRRRRGRVINISSVVGFCALPLSSAYCSSKFALEGLSESLFHELRPCGVQVALVEPGRFRTRFGDNVRWGERSLDAASAYARQTANYRRLKERYSSGEGVPAGPVVRAVLRLAHARRMPLRTRVGRDAAAAHWARRLLPGGAADRLLGLAFDRMLLRDGS